MVTNGGLARLRQSQHHPFARQSQYSSQPEQALSTVTQVDKSNNPTTIERQIQACVIPGKQEEVTRLLRVLRATITAPPPLTPPCDKEPVTIGQLKAILKDTL